MRIKLVLRLFLAFIFATFAVIFLQLIPSDSGEDLSLVKVLITLVSAGVGFLVFPDIARTLSISTMRVFNFVVSRVSSEVSTQMLRLSRQAHINLPGSTPSQVGAISYSKPLILDTSAIIDGRILDTAKTGFISGLLLIPKFVLLELQQVSDSSDDLKRARGRRGFEIVEELKKIKNLRVEVWDKDQAGKSTDDKILNLARSLHGKIITTDFNLNKVATISNVSVLNINDLANVLKTVSLPGERITIKIVHIGKEEDQGVGYLQDGTMVVVEKGADKIGKTLNLEVTKSIQIPQGRMIFGKES